MFATVLTVALLLFALVPASLRATANPSGSRIVHITPTGNGARDGSSWDHAATLPHLPKLLARAGPGTKVFLRADMGVYETPKAIEIRAAGGPGHPITVTGVDGSGRPMKAKIVGTRAEPYTPTGAPGSEVFRLLDGAKHLRFEHLSFHNQGNGCFRIGADLSDLTIEHVDASNVRRFIENSAAGRASSASVAGLVVRDVTVKGFSKGAIRLQDDTHDVLLEDIIGDSERQDGDNFAEGVALEGTVHDVVLRRVTMRNAQDTIHSYWNGDGFTTESGTYRIQFEDTVASGNTDAGYDLKSNETVLVRAVAEDNKKNFKFWGRSTATECVGKAPRLRGGTSTQDQVNILQRADVTIANCRFVDRDPGTIVFHLQGGRLRVVASPVSKHDDAKLSLVDPGGIFIVE